MAGKQSPEYETFAKLQEDLRVGIQNDIEAVAGRAYSGGLITSENLQELTIQATAQHTRARSFLMMIGNKIEECPKNIGKFKDCLDPHVHQNLVKKIDDRLKAAKSAAQPPVADFSEPRGSTLDDDADPEVFISYKWEEGVPEFANAIAAELEKRRIGHWKDDHQMSAGDNITKRVTEGITKCKLFLPILSEGYISERGEKWCQRECALAVDKGKIIVPIQWGETEISDDIKFSVGPVTLRAKYEPGAGPATRTQQLKKICDAVQEQLGRSQN